MEIHFLRQEQLTLRAKVEAAEKTLGEVLAALQAKGIVKVQTITESGIIKPQPGMLAEMSHEQVPSLRKR